MHDAATVRRALGLAERGLSATEIAPRLGLPRSTVRDWLAGTTPRRARGPSCAECGRPEHDFGALDATYVHMFGLNLGDGCLSASPRGLFKLRVFLDVKYPGIIDDAMSSISAVKGGSASVALRPKNCVEVYCYWRSWPCLIPQHGAGKKHERPIVLEPWQVALVDRWPEALLRGLIQSDDCRFLNTGRNWICPRYSFANKSADNRSIFCGACDLVGVHWTAAGEKDIYVSRKADVEFLDGFIGPKR
jgi:hypothetical protein